MKKVLATILALVMAIGVTTAAWADDCAGGESCAHQAAIGTTHYNTLKEAIEAVPVNGTTPTEIVLLRNVDNAAGMTVASGKNFVVDFNTFTYTINKPGAGSTNTETNGFQLLKGSTVVFKNGVINVSEDNLVLAVAPAKNIMRLIQNYSKLTLEDMTIDGTNLYGANLVMSFNNDPVTISGNTSITSPEGVKAFDADGNWDSYNRSEVTVNTTGTITGGIELGQGVLNIANVNLVGDVTLCTKCGESETTGQKERATITGGTFSSDVTEYLGEGKVLQKNGDTYTAVTDGGITGGTYTERPTVPDGYKVVGNADGTFTVEKIVRYYYNSTTTTTDTKKDETKGSPKTFDAGVGIYAVSAILSVTGMAYVGKKKF